MATALSTLFTTGIAYGEQVTGPVIWATDGEVVTEDTTIDGDLIISRNATCSPAANITVNGDVYVYGRLDTYGAFNVTGTVNCLNTSLGNAGSYSYGYFYAHGGGTVADLNCTDNWIDAVCITHSFTDWIITTPATTTEEGVKTRYCYKCGYSETDSIPKITYSITEATVKAIATQGYTGKAITPKVTISHLGNTLVEGTDYTLSYKNNVKVGKASITIKGKGVYTGKSTISFEIKYKITYKLNGGKNSSKNPNYYDSSAAIKLANPSRTGYTFGGWYSDSKFKTRVKTIAAGSTGNITLYAKWVCNKVSNLKVKNIIYCENYLSWSKVTNATSYIIYRSTSENGTYEQIGTTTFLNYTDTTAKEKTTYYYKVAGTFGNGGALCSAVAVTTPAKSDPATNPGDNNNSEWTKEIK